VLAIRKNTSRSNHALLKSGDLFEIILVQMKGGSARKPSANDLDRLRAVKRRYGAKYIVLFSWRLRKDCSFAQLTRSGWVRATATELFG
jgi:hypothetical protein